MIVKLSPSVMIIGMIVGVIVLQWAGEVIGRRMTNAKTIVDVLHQTRAVSGQSETVVRSRGVSGVGFRGSAGEAARGVY